MTNKIFEKQDLIRFTNEPLEWQYQRILAKVMEAVNLTDGEIVIAFSGGKDSALLLDMYCEIAKDFGKTNKPIQVAWADTTNETIAMRKYVPWFIERCQNKYGVEIHLHTVRPKDNQNIITVMRTEGLPFVSKMVSGLLRKVSKDMESNGVTYNDVKHLHNPTPESRDALIEMGLSNTTVIALTGWSRKLGDFGKDFVLPKQWFPLLDIKNVTGKNIIFTEKCCDILKKEPVGRLNFPSIMTGEQAVESKMRELSWLKNGCNYQFSDGSVRSRPLGAVSLDAVLYAIKYRNVPICSDYGEVVFNEHENCYKCTKADRTGCALCGFGIKFDPQRFIRLQETEPSKVKIAFTPIERGGLGYREVCEYMNEYCKTNIQIPEV